MSNAESEKKVEAPKRVIPKFASFKPPTATATAIPLIAAPSSKDEKHSGENGKERQHSHRRGHHRSRSRGHERERRHRRDRDQTKDDEERRRRRKHWDDSPKKSLRRRDTLEEDGAHQHQKTGSLLPEATSLIHQTSPPRSPSPKPESWDAPQKQYFMDTRGDEKNLIYGTIHRYSIPDYRRSGAGRIVGLPTNMRIDRDKGDGKVLVLKSGGNVREDSSVRGMRQAFAKLESKDLKRLRVRKDESGLEEAFSRGLDFVPLSIKTKKRKTRDGERSDGSDDDYRDHYRSIEGLKKSSGTPDDPDLDYASESQSEGDYIASSVWGDQKQMVELVRKVDTEPKDIEAWMAYVNHHDTLVSGTGRRKTAAEKRSTAEIKLDILQKALEKNPGNERLLLKYMDIAVEIWDSHKLLSKWRRILEENPTIISLWTKYINFRQTDFLSFTYPECLKCFYECLSVLKAAAFKTDVRSPTREALDKVILYIFVRAVLLMDESGYKENAVAAVQAMLELNLFPPHDIICPTSQGEFDALLEQLERFWDSEAPRIGEEKALGWASFVASGGNGDSPDPAQYDLQLPPLDVNDPFGSWTDAEVEWSQRIGMPARTIDEVEEDDPYRVILFSDLKAFMFYFSSESARKKMIEAFLMYKNMPLLNPQSSNSAAIEDIFLRSGLSELRLDSSNTWFWPKKRRIGDNPFEFKLRNFPLGRESIFSQSTVWFGGIKNVTSVRPEDVRFIRNTLKMLVDNGGDESLALYYLTWEWGSTPDGIKKVAKSLLKRFKICLPLWSAYAQIEWHDAGVDAGRKVFSMALGISKECAASSRRDSILLWHAWIWHELWQGNALEALHLILSIEHGEPPKDTDGSTPGYFSKSLLLKTKGHLEDQQHTMLSLRFIEHAGVFNDIRALLEYLAEGVNLDASLAVYDTFILELERRSMTGSDSQIHELCLLRKARLIYHHSTTAKPFKPATLRSNLETALETFPQNLAFLSLYAWNESRTKIENRLRMIVRDRVLLEGKETVTGWLFAIWAEMRTGEHYNIHTVRNLFEQGVSCDRTRSSVHLWMMFVEFELQQQDPSRAKEILFRGIRHCPWSKGLIMMAFTELRSLLRLEDLRKLLSIMTSEKELRVHDVTELEDMVEEMYNGRSLAHEHSGDFIALPDDDPTDEEMDE
ncbi:NRDE-2, necessary for RNA interference-domain-containing protein [Trichophaea hybrida]|nr:NRDE-2, necessary for RNA interference-domain-containing protein [Trichophaea hybrida]